MNLLDQIKEQDISSLSIVGLAKNAGKTVTLNHLIQLADIYGFNLGLTSIGRDGEKEDIVTNTEKPQIKITEGTIIAVARGLLVKSKLNFEILETTGFSTPLGEVVIARSHESGFVELSGPSTKKQLKVIKNKLIKLGADLVIIDGALSRKSLATPSLAEATILATGAVIGEDVATVVNKTAFQVELFNLKSSSDLKLVEKIKNTTINNNVALIDDTYNVIPLKVKTALSGVAEICERIDDTTRAILFRGALVEGVVKKLLDKIDNLDQIRLIVNDATHVFLSPRIYNRFQRLGGKLEVIDEINLIAVTVNPFSPVGRSLDPIKLVTNLGQVVEPISVYEVMLGKKYGKEGVENIEVYQSRNK